MYVTIEFRDDEDRLRANIVGIHESSELAKQSIDEESAKKMEALEWPNRDPPELGATVAIAGRQIVSDRPNGLLSLWQAIRKPPELTELRQQNEALAQHNAQLHTQVNSRDKIYHSRLKRDRTKSQFKDLWMCSTVQKALENMLADFALIEAPTLSERIMAVPDNDTVTHANRVAQENRITADSFDDRRALAYNHVLLHRGDRVQFYRTDDELGVTDSDLGEIIKLFPDQRTAAVALDRLEISVSELVFVPLNDYGHLDLGYATTYDRADNMQLYHVFILADNTARQLVDSLSAENLEIYADKLTAYSQFPELAGKPEMCQSIDMEADPLSQYRTRE